ncbi:MAG: hypothetical protein GEU86_10695 [Actinophytocola sp.]|nr:hypothetical protein [Actinophytocola sp.]
MFYHDRVAQLSFFSADANVPTPADLAGVLCAPGELASFASTTARLSVTLDDDWRAAALAAELGRRGVQARIVPSGNGNLLVRTAFRADLIALAASWTRGAAKVVPDGFQLDGATLRCWALVAGRPAGGPARRAGFLLGLDPGAPETHEPLLRAAARAGLVPGSHAGSLVATRSGAPALRVSGSKRLRRLAELVGECPRNVNGAAGAESVWPAVRLGASA